MSHWLDVAAKGLAGGSYSRRDVLRRGGAIAAGSLIGSAAAPFSALAATPKCTETTCPDGTCCEGRCLTDRDFGCCHNRIYLRLNKHCCPQAPAGATHTCLDGEDCCGKQECCQHNEICCGTGQCIPNKSGNIGCCNGFTYNKRVDHCCPEHDKDEAHFCAKDESCCGKKDCCKRDEICCGTGQCIPNKKGNIGCCNGFTYNKNVDQCCLEFPADEAHFCAKSETCCGEKACCGKDQECCGAGAQAQCMPKGQCNQCPSGQVMCGGICCDAGNCINGVCGTCPLPGCTLDRCCPANGYPNSGYCCSGQPTPGESLVCCFCGNTCAGYGMTFPCTITNDECSQMCSPC